MKPFLLFISVLLGTLMAPGGALAQSDPYGELDSVAVESRTVSAGSSFSLGVILWNDEAVAGFSIPLKYPTALATFDSVSFAKSRAGQWSILRSTVDEQAGTILLGGLAVGDPVILPGDGSIVELFFHASPSAQTGQTGVIDSGYIPPAGQFIISSFQATSIRPAFRAGHLVIGGENEAPEFDPVSAKSINEGETLSFTVVARDPDGSVISLHATKLPPGGRFKDNGDGTGALSWAVPYIGPGSASESPYAVSFIASDGKATVMLEVPIRVINLNRPPQLTVDGDATVPSGDSVYIPIVASDPDLEPVSFSAAGLPQGAEILPTNPGYVIWHSSIADSGEHSFVVTATDASGGRASKQVTLHLLPTLPIELSLEDKQASSNEFVTVALSMLNRVEVSGFSFVIQYDPSILALVSVQRDSIRTRLWQTFSATVSSDGKIFIDAHCTPGLPGGGPLAPDSGGIVYFRFVTSPDPDFAGQFTRIEFKVIDSLSNTDNVVYQTGGSLITANQISFNSGSVLIKKYDGLIGDLNLNGVAFEIADVVYFTNYFIDPVRYPLTGERWVNSDVNQDGNAGTLGDLVALLRILNDGSGKVTAAGAPNAVGYQIEKGVKRLSYELYGSGEIAAALYTFRIDRSMEVALDESSALQDMDVKANQADDLFKVLIYSHSGGTFQVPNGELFALIGGGNVALVSQEYVDAFGNPVAVACGKQEAQLPQQFDLLQNYPNPFNPETVVAFDLPRPGHAALAVFNVLGEKVSEPVDGYLPAGRHEVVIDGKSSSGEPLPSGVYFYRLSYEGSAATRKMLLLK